MAKDMQNREDQASTRGTPGTPLGRNAKSMDWQQFKEARLFATADRATLTFYLGKEVASIHFDLARREIFFRGHNVKNMTLTQDQWVLMQQFAEYLKAHKVAPELYQAYEASLAQFLPRR